MKDRNFKVFIILIAASLFILILFVGPSGILNRNQASLGNDVILVETILNNPDFNNNHEFWHKTHWRSAGGEPTTSTWTVQESSVTMSISGYDASFYAVGLSQGDGPKTLWQRTPYIGLDTVIDDTKHNVVTWRGKMDSASLEATGCLGMGFNAWFDVTLTNGTIVPLEIFIFFYQAGVYSLPVGMYRDYGYRGGEFYKSLFEPAVHPSSWRYFYFHAQQLKLGEAKEYSFELNNYLDIVRRNAGEPYKSGVFTLTRVDATMELFMASGTFTIDYLSLEQTVR